ncbi:hypothetical protein ACOME3_003180 [Neoechinorhynchus agilis]
MNAWGPGTYADMIAQAIQSSRDQRLTLSEIYEWIGTNVDYFRQRSGEKEREGWQNSIRHNLSIGNTFLKIANKNGKGSHWILNPERFELDIGAHQEKRPRLASNEPNVQNNTSNNHGVCSAHANRYQQGQFVNPVQITGSFQQPCNQANQQAIGDPAQNCPNPLTTYLSMQSNREQCTSIQQAGYYQGLMQPPQQTPPLNNPVQNSGYYRQTMQLTRIPNPAMQYTLRHPADWNQIMAQPVLGMPNNTQIGGYQQNMQQAQVPATWNNPMQYTNMLPNMSNLQTLQPVNNFTPLYNTMEISNNQQIMQSDPQVNSSAYSMISQPIARNAQNMTMENLATFPYMEQTTYNQPLNNPPMFGGGQNEHEIEPNEQAQNMAMGYSVTFPYMEQTTYNEQMNNLPMFANGRNEVEIEPNQHAQHMTVLNSATFPYIEQTIYNQPLNNQPMFESGQNEHEIEPNEGDQNITMGNSATFPYIEQTTYNQSLNNPSMFGSGQNEHEIEPNRQAQNMTMGNSATFPYMEQTTYNEQMNNLPMFENGRNEPEIEPYEQAQNMTIGNSATFSYIEQTIYNQPLNNQPMFESGQNEHEIEPNEGDQNITMGNSATFPYIEQTTYNQPLNNPSMFGSGQNEHEIEPNRQAQNMTMGNSATFPYMEHTRTQMLTSSMRGNVRNEHEIELIEQSQMSQPISDSSLETDSVDDDKGSELTEDGDSYERSIDTVESSGTDCGT